MRIRFKKVKHPGCHQDYRIYYDGIHVGNIRAGFHHRAGIDWSARSDVDGVEIMLSGRPGYSRPKLAEDLIATMRALGYQHGVSEGTPFMQTTKDVGWDEKVAS